MLPRLCGAVGCVGVAQDWGQFDGRVLVPRLVKGCIILGLPCERRERGEGRGERRPKNLLVFALADRLLTDKKKEGIHAAKEEQRSGGADM
jgi:hypothetical protein